MCIRDSLYSSRSLRRSSTIPAVRCSMPSNRSSVVIERRFFFRVRLPWLLLSHPPTGCAWALRASSAAIPAASSPATSRRTSPGHGGAERVCDLAGVRRPRRCPTARDGLCRVLRSGGTRSPPPNWKPSPTRSKQRRTARPASKPCTAKQSQTSRAKSQTHSPVGG